MLTEFFRHLQNFRVDHGDRMRLLALAILVALGAIHDQQPRIHADLRRGQPDAGRKIHGLEHVMRELAEIIIDLRDRIADLFQARIGMDENGPDHGSELCDGGCEINGVRRAPHPSIASQMASVCMTSRRRASRQSRFRRTIGFSAFTVTLSKKASTGARRRAISPMAAAKSSAFSAAPMAGSAASSALKRACSSGSSANLSEGAPEYSTPSFCSSAETMLAARRYAISRFSPSSVERKSCSARTRLTRSTRSSCPPSSKQAWMTSWRMS